MVRKAKPIRNLACRGCAPVLGGVLSIMLAIAQGTPAQAQGGWQQGTPFPSPSEELLGSGANGKMYAFAGLTQAPEWRPKGYVYEYDPETKAWAEKKKMALPAHHVAFTEYSGKIYAFGGFVAPNATPSGWVPIDNSWEYDPKNDTWKALASMPGKRGAAVAAALNGKIYVIGGAALVPGSSETVIRNTPTAWPHHAVGTVQEYDIASNTWRERSPMPTARNHLAVGAVNGKIYAIGGRLSSAFSSPSSPTDVVEEYDPATDIWTNTKTKMPTPRSALAWGVYNGRIYVAGGEFQDSRMAGAFRAVEAYEPATNRWYVLPSMPRGRHGMAGGIVGDEFHLVSGDLQSSGSGIPQSARDHDVLRLSDYK